MSKIMRKTMSRTIGKTLGTTVNNRMGRRMRMKMSIERIMVKEEDMMKRDRLIDVNIIVEKMSKRID